MGKHFIFNYNCIDFMNKIIDRNSVERERLFNCIITDIPYNVSRKNNFNTIGRKGLDFGEWDKEFDTLKWLENATKLVNKNGSMLIFCSIQQISFLITKLNELGFEHKDVIVWVKSNPMPRNIERRYVQSNEYILWVVKKGAKWTFNKPKDISYLKQIIENPICAGKERTEHPTQKPLELMKKLISIHTNENDYVLDCFMGSGSTGVACKLLNRNFVGVELDKNYFNIAKKRIEEI